MSHLTTFKNNSLVNTRKEMLEKAVAELGLGIDFNHKIVQNTWINEHVDAAFTKNGEHISVGLRFEKNLEGEEIAVVAGDFWGTGLNQEDLTNQLAQVYQKHRIMEICTESNWYIDAENIETNSDGEIVIEAYRYA